MEPLPCLDDPPEGTCCSRCGCPIRLWKPEFCASCHEEDMAELVAKRQAQSEAQEG